MLVNLTVSLWQAKAQDKKITQEVASNHNVKTDTGKYIKQLVDKNESSYKNIAQASTKLRQYHYSNTLPWLDEGIRILPAKNYLEYSTEIRKLQSEYDQGVLDFVRDYENLKSKAKTELNTLFNEKDYPSHVDKFFGVTVRFMPFPDSQDFRVTVSDEESKILKAKLESDIKESLETMVSDVLYRLQKTVKHLADTLSESRQRYHASMIENISQACETVAKLNITNNKNVENLRQEIKVSLASVSTQDLRTDEKLRNQVKNQADDILAKMEKFL